eukprot:NODE_18_length_47517_cov_0.674814.p26 type:complete len:126 gc:universal NODE_18_length_47517_cov_0.674814:22078-22455(+)
MSIRKLAGYLNEEYDVQISKSTLRRFTVKNGYLNKRCKKKLYLSSVHKYKRFQFALENVNKDMDWFRKIFWTDEFMVKQFSNRKFETYWSRQSDTTHNEVVFRQKQQGGFPSVFGEDSPFGEFRD